MINNKELEISNSSYTNKDFGVIYTEILNTARKISELWSPQTSNESDPGVVLLKLLAFIGDKLNYNLDKNILETGMPSATQEVSMRKLCDMMGYAMNYYVSASTNITFTYKGTGLDYDEGSTAKKFLELPKFKTVVSTEDGSVQYVLWQTLSLDTTSKSDTVLAKEGYLNTVNIGDSDKIVLDNLDSQNRLYFGESQVAQNGILIKNYNSDDSYADFWECVDNLNVQEPGKKCFKFGYDSNMGLPYVEFPVDITNIIGEGLSIRYLVTSGYYGNVGVGNLNKLLSPTSIEVSPTGDTISFTDEDGNTDLNIKNNSAATNGKNPETIDSAYNNFKKTVGTFNTLVTCRDYANYIYNSIYNSSGNHAVSNVQVGDRRTDLNKSKNIVTFGENGQYVVNDSTDYVKLFIYALRGINNPGNQSEYKDSFKVMDDISLIADFLDADDSVSTISYKYTLPEPTDIALIKILYDLDVKITTNYKVNIAEQLDIKKNVIEALRRNFYSRNIDYGYEIPYDSIYNCILEADNRIKSIILKEPALDLQYINRNNQIMEPCGTSDADYMDSPYLKILAKNVLAGRVPLFDYDTRFRYEFGMGKYSDNSVPTVLTEAESFYSEAPKTLSTAESSINSNEFIQLIGPKLADEFEYSTYVNYYYEGANIDKNKDTILGANDKLVLVYTDSSKGQVEVLYKEGDIIRSTFDITPTDASTRTKITKQLNNADIIAALGRDTIACLGIDTNESIYKRTIVKHEFDSNIKVAWLVNDDVEQNIIADKFTLVPGTSDEYEYILGNSDYFIYSLDGESSYEIFGSGTSIRIKGITIGVNSVEDYLPGNCNIPNLDEIYEYGLDALSGILKSVTFSSAVSLTVQVNNIITFAQGDVVKLSSGSLAIDNTWKALTTDLSYKYIGETSYTKLEGYDLGSSIYNNWRIRSRLDLVAGPEQTQILASNQSITFIRHEDPNDPAVVSTYTISGASGYNGRIRTNLNIDMAGGGSLDKPISLSLIDPTSALSEVTFPVSVLSFVDNSNVVETFPRSSDYYTSEIINTEMKPLSNSVSVLNPSNIGASNILLMVYVSWFDTADGVVTISSTGANIKNYITGNNISQISYADGNKMYILEIPSGCTSITFSTASTVSQGQIKISPLAVVSGINSRFNFEYLEKSNEIISGSLTTALLDLIKEYDTNSLFYYNCTLDSSEEIDEEDLSSPFAFTDPNNIACKFALAYIDVDGSAIDITRSSKL